LAIHKHNFLIDVIVMQFIVLKEHGEHENKRL